MACAAQAMDRAHRIGQKKEVNVFRFCVENSIEEKVIEKAYKKLRLDALVIQQGRLTENTKSVNKDDLLAMVRYGAEMVFSSEVRPRYPLNANHESEMTRRTVCASLLPKWTCFAWQCSYRDSGAHHVCVFQQ